MRGIDGLERVAAIAREMGAPQAAEADALLQRAQEGRFYVACVGEFKRGKSTLINSLVREAVLPTGVVPVTSVSTVLRYGEPGARVHQDGQWRNISSGRLADYVSQERNPANVKRVAAVEVYVPHPLLQEGLCLVDTPGLGSVFDANTTSAIEFLPHIDAAIVVLGADPPISGDELRFVSELARTVDTLLFVLNKADRISEGHRDEAIGFTHRVLQEALGRAVGPIYQVSAISPSRSPATAEGWHALLGTLERLSRTSGRQLVESAVRRGISRLEGDLQALIKEEQQALAVPLEESEKRIQSLQSLAGNADLATRELEPLLALAERDLSAAFAERRRMFLAAALPATEAELEKRFDVGQRHEQALELANEIARRRLEPWLVESEQEVERGYRLTMDRFVTLARDYLRRAAALAGVANDALRLDDPTLDAPRGFYFTDLLRYHVSPYPWFGLVDRLLPRPIARRRRLGAARRYLAHLLDVNATRVESDLTNRVYESRVRIRTALERVLRDVGRAAAAAAERGREAQSVGAAAVTTAQARLARWRAELRATDTRS